MEPEDVARRFIALRRSRDAFFGADLFGEPAWELLLFLFIARRENRSVSVADAGVALGSPASVVTRWVTVLAAHGLIENADGAAEERLRLVGPAEQAIAEMLATSGLYVQNEDAT